MKHTPLGLGKNNFDRLAAAGLVAGEDSGEGLKVKTEARKAELKELDEKVKKVELFLASLYVEPRDKQLRRLESTTVALKKLLASKLPVGAKRHIEACFNEVQSLLEGVSATNSKLDKQELALTASANARTEIQAMIQAAEHRLEKVQADSSSDVDIEEFLRKVGPIIKKNDQEAHKLAPIADKSWVLARVPVVPIDGGVSAAKLAQAGFKAESLAGYPVIHNQLVVGINPRKVSGGGDVEKYADMARKLKESGVDAADIRKLENRIAGYDRDIKKDKAELEHIDEVKHKGHKAKLEKEVADLEGKREVLVKQMQDLIAKSGIDYDEYIKMGQRMQREGTATTESIEAEVKRIVKALEKQMRVKLAIVGGDSSKSHKNTGKERLVPCRYKNGAWFWVMPEQQLNALARASASGRPAITKWGFAFN